MTEPRAEWLTTPSNETSVRVAHMFKVGESNRDETEVIPVFEVTAARRGTRSSYSTPFVLETPAQAAKLIVQLRKALADFAELEASNGA